MQLDEQKLNQQMGQAIVDMGAAMIAPLIVIGDKLGLYKALAENGPLSTLQLSEKTRTAERYVREWLRAQAASGYVTYHSENETYSLSPEQALMFAREASPAFVIGGFQTAVAATRSLNRLQEVFQTGEGIGWHEHDHDLFHGTERFYKPGYTTNLISSWIPSLTDMEEKLKKGAKVADLGCGHGASSILLAQAYPNATFTGIDYHEESIQVARQRAAEAGVADRTRFEVATTTNYDGGPYDLVMIFDALHDLGDPIGASAHVLSTLKPDGAWMIVEPFAGDQVSDNLHPLGRVMYAASTMLCVSNSLSQEGRMALGAQAGEARIREVVRQGGFTRFRRASQTQVNLVFEARP